MGLSGENEEEDKDPITLHDLILNAWRWVTDSTQP